MQFPDDLARHVGKLLEGGVVITLSLFALHEINALSRTTGEFVQITTELQANQRDLQVQIRDVSVQVRQNSLDIRENSTKIQGLKEQVSEAAEIQVRPNRSR